MNINVAFERMMDNLTPPEFKQDLQTKKRIRMFIYSHVFGPFIGLTIPLTLAFIDPNPWPHVPILALSIAGFWPFLILLRLFPGAYVQLSLISVCNDAFAILWGIYHYGGTSSPFLVWVVLIPLLTFLYIGATRVSKIFVLVLSIGGLGALYLLYRLEGFPHLVDRDAMVLPGLASGMGVIVYTYMMSLYYTAIVDNQSELVREIDRHHDTMLELRQANEITEQARATAECERATAQAAQAEAERANEAKTAFLARMSHELRTPLNAILGYSELLLEDTSVLRRPEEIQDLKRIASAGKHLLAMVNDVLDIAKIEAGKIHMYSEPVDLYELIDDVAGAAAILVRENNNRFILDCPRDLGVIMGDEIKIRQAMLNLLGNATKFTKNGSITLTVKRYCMSGEAWVDIAVTDTGIGISPEEQSRLFTNFSQANKSIGLTYGGSGLGLSLSQNLCRLMGGSISLESTAKIGSTFTMHLPLNLKVYDDTPDVPRSPIIFQPEGRRAFDMRAHNLVHDHRHKPEYDDMVEEAEADLREKLEGLHGIASHLRDQAARPRVMVCDTDQTYLSKTTRTLQRLGYAPLSVDTPSEVLRVARTTRPSAVMLSDRLEASGDVRIQKIFSEDVLLNNIPVIGIIDTQTVQGTRKNTHGSLFFSSSEKEVKDRLNQVISDSQNIRFLRAASKNR